MKMDRYIKLGIKFRLILIKKNFQEDSVITSDLELMLVSVILFKNIVKVVNILIFCSMVTSDFVNFSKDTIQQRSRLKNS